MKRIAGIAALGMAGLDVNAAQHLQTRRRNHAEQLLPTAQLQVFSNVGQDQPTFAARFQMLGQTGFSSEIYSMMARMSARAFALHSGITCGVMLLFLGR